MNDKDNIINGKLSAERMLAKLAEDILKIKEQHNIVPKLAIILVGSNPASLVYVRNKLQAASKIGIATQLVHFQEEISQDELLANIGQLNLTQDISGIIIQLPLPLHIDKNIILSAVDPLRDVDGFHPINVGYLHSGMQDGFIPCTALGCHALIKQFEPNLSGKNAVIIGRSNIVGKPLSALLLQSDCTVTICHSKTKDLPSITTKADIIVSSIGSPLKLTAEYFSKHAMVIDVGITRLHGQNKVVGDVDFTNVADKVRLITPVPNGVGPMTVAFLLQNTFKAMLKQNGFTMSKITFE